ncbi:BTAD domain-containing putative transcriptional regulator [Nonomuraea sp. NPDC050310]|uniref:BTAD domain-containing putative transcriptional regulator n=1 Tax=Nonomuraea sp. NPDC050310 TaxID=3154935 RepID=UPI0033F6D730
MRLEILGPVRAGEAEVGGPRVRALLVLLALEAGRIVPADRLIDGLYGERPPEDAANALQSQVSRLRRALGRELIEHHPAGYRLAVDPLEVDLHRFERLAAEGRRARGEGDPERAAALLGEALALWRGRPEVPETQATRLEELRLAAVEDEVRARLDLGGHRELVARLSELVRLHPLREGLRALLIRALYGSGRQADALAVFEEGRRILDEELGVEPGPELAAAQLAVLRADPALGAVRNAPVPPARVGLRAQLTSFVGRSGDLARLATLLTTSRLVTLIGPGGAGKTRLAVEAAAAEPGDVTLVELAPVPDGSQLTAAVLDALGVRESLRSDVPTPDPAARLITALAGRRLLLVLDNCEHVVDAAAGLADRLLATCPDLRVLATSREALAITGEAVHPVTPLKPPPPGLPAAEALTYPAVRLFADRAAAVRPEFAVDEATVEHVTRICRALDGLPLAIELAAARLRTLPLGELAGRLDDRFRLLARGSRTALPRHQTLRAVVAWSWDLLDPEEQALARRLTVFVGGASLEAAERVCGLPEELLHSLVDKSLVAEVDGRYRMLETIRAFCAEHLAEAGEVEATRRAHAAFYLELAQRADPHLRGGEQLEWLALLDAESDDLRAALGWAISAGEVAFGLRLVTAVACYWWLRGHRLISAELVGELLGLVGPEPPPGLWEEYAMCVLIAGWTGRPTPELTERLRRLRAEVSIKNFPYRVEFLSMFLSMFTGPPDDLVVDDLVNYPREGLSPWICALTHIGPAFVWVNTGETELAKQALREGLAAFTEIGDRWGTTLALSGLGDLAFQSGDHAEALRLAERGGVLARELGSGADEAEYLARKADCLLLLGELEQARESFQASVELSRRAGAADGLARALIGLGEVELAAGHSGAGRTLLEQALAECPDAWYSAEELKQRAQLALARADLADGEPRTALRRCVDVLAWGVAGNAGVAVLAMKRLGEVVEACGDAELAARLPQLSPAEALALLRLRKDGERAVSGR